MPGVLGGLAGGVGGGVRGGVGKAVAGGGELGLNGACMRDDEAVGPGWC